MFKFYKLKIMLYGGLNGLITLDKFEILKRVSQKDIFEMVFEEVDLQGYYTNPIRIDSLAGAFFKWHGDKLWFCDFADTKTARDCFEMIKDMYKINFYQALSYINQHFKLGLAETDNFVIPSKIIVEEKIITHAKPANHITFRSKNFDKHHRKYWQSYEITKSQLIEDNTSATIWYRFWSDKKQDWVIIRPMASEVTYTIDQWQGHVKICRARHREKLGKWITNCTKNDIGGINNLSFSGNTLIITKSYKDWRVLINQGLNAIWFQNEGMFPDKDKLEAICMTFTNIVIWFDNDKAGIAASEKLHTLIKSFHSSVNTIHLPITCLNNKIKDPSDCIQKDKLFFHQFLKLNKLWTRNY